MQAPNVNRPPAQADYHFVTRWRVLGTAAVVADVLGDALSLPEWWPSVYLAAEELVPGDEHGLGRVIDLHTKGWLPYTLRWQFRVTEADAPRGFSIEAWGDLEGNGAWTLVQDGDWVDVTYDWRVHTRHPLLLILSFAVRPLLAANHRWAMAQGEESLRLELARRRARSEAERKLIPAPPQPAQTAGWVYTAAIFGALILLRWTVKRAI